MSFYHLPSVTKATEFFVLFSENILSKEQLKTRAFKFIIFSKLLLSYPCHRDNMTPHNHPQEKNNNSFFILPKCLSFSLCDTDKTVLIILPEGIFILLIK